MMLPHRRFKERPRARAGGSPEELQKVLGWMEGDIESLVASLLVAHPQECAEHRWVRWAVIRLRVLLQKLRTGLSFPEGDQKSDLEALERKLLAKEAAR